MSIKRPLILCLATLCSAELYAGASATITGASDYLFTGISQTDSNPALQGSLDYSFDNGIYVGAWFSNVDFPTDAGEPSDPASVEQDFYIGWVWDVSEDLSLNFAALRYEYTGAPSDGYDYTNYLVGFTLFSNTVINLYFADNEDYYGEDTDGDGKNDRGGRHTWVELEQTIPLVENWDLVLGLDYDKNEEVDDFNGADTGDDYTHWKVGVATQFVGIDFELSYNDTDIDSNDDPYDLADARLVLTASKTFDF